MHTCEYTDLHCGHIARFKGTELELHTQYAVTFQNRLRLVSHNVIFTSGLGRCLPYFNHRSQSVWWWLTKWQISSGITLSPLKYGIGQWMICPCLNPLHIYHSANIPKKFTHEI